MEKGSVNLLILENQVARALFHELAYNPDMRTSAVSHLVLEMFIHRRQPSYQYYRAVRRELLSFCQQILVRIWKLLKGKRNCFVRKAIK